MTDYPSSKKMLTLWVVASDKDLLRNPIDTGESYAITIGEGLNTPLEELSREGLVDIVLLKNGTPKSLENAAKVPEKMRAERAGIIGAESLSPEEKAAYQQLGYQHFIPSSGIEKFLSKYVQQRYLNE